MEVWEKEEDEEEVNASRMSPMSKS